MNEEKELYYHSPDSEEFEPTYRIICGKCGQTFSYDKNCPVSDDEKE
jgi:hypothetical protein